MIAISRRWTGYSVAATAVAFAAAFFVACGETPTAPAAATPVSGAKGGLATAQNSPPNLIWRSVPVADMTTVPYPTITGVAPFKVTLNLCPSDDPDMIHLPDGTLDPKGDSLNWQFYFGDTQPAPVRPDFEQYCRVEHTYALGQYVATLVVTDKHQEDQGNRVGQLARREQKVTINSLPLAPPSPGCVAPTSSTIPSQSNNPFSTAQFFTGTGLTYSVSVNVACPASRGVSAMGNNIGATINPTTGVVTVNGNCGCLQVTATNSCGSTSQTTFWCD
jgi:hypothetical protein